MNALIAIQKLKRAVERYGEGVRLVNADGTDIEFIVPQRMNEEGRFVDDSDRPEECTHCVLLVE